MTAPHISAFAGHALPRLLEPRLIEALGDTPAVLVHGSRQCGKTTLAGMVGEPRGYSYLTFDDDALRVAASSDPAGFVQGLAERVILDEVQRVPEIFAALKLVIDTDRTPGRFILTGSANVLLVPSLSDSLAGRMGILQLHPLSQCEIERTNPSFLDRLFAADFATGPAEPLGWDLADRVAKGGFPAAIARDNPVRRRAWYRDYVETIVQRDVRSLARIRSLDDVPRLLSAVAAQTAQLANIAELAAPFELTRQTVHEHVTLLERVFLLERLPAWHNNRLNRLVKRPKLHMGDTGVASALLGLDADVLNADREALGPLLETFVLQELHRQASGRVESANFYHLRDRDGYEVDIVIEEGAAIAGIEVKASSTVSERDFSALRKLRGATKKRFRAGVVLYDGTATAKFDDGFFAAPIRMLWET